MPEEHYSVRLDKVFEGPLDLLLYLIKKNEVDIHDIPISEITDQYLKYLEWMKATNIDFAGEFLLMAATLIHVKSRMLLPLHEGDEDDEDPRLEITRPLVEYLQMKSAADKLSSRDILGKDIFKRKPGQEAEAIDQEEGLIRIGLFELIDAFGKILADLDSDQSIEITAERVSVKCKIADILKIIEEQGTITFNELFSTKSNKSEVILTFLAILEMVRLSLINVIQHVQTGIIRLSS